MTNQSETQISDTKLPDVKIGCPIWQHPSWPSAWFGNPAARKNNLEYYAQQLNSIEGNTTFYQLPDTGTVVKWRDAVPEQFRFCFKFHQSITHQASLRHCEAAVTEQLHRMALLEHKLASVMIQLPAQFGPEQLPVLAHFLAQLPKDFRYSVEVRHQRFFAKGDDEKRLNQLLMQHQVDRIIMDTRALFTGDADSPLTAEVRTKKPRVPVNVIATGKQPIMRFVGNNNDSDNLTCLQPWVKKCHQWREQGLSPYLFFHRPDNKDAPWLAQQFIQLYNQTYAANAAAQLPALTFTEQAEQTSLF